MGTMDLKSGSASAIKDTAYEACRSFSTMGKTYSPGDPFDISGLPDHKVGQLLNRRYIRPANPRQTDP
jgi:hypothetical protein